jgi:arylsulfatase A
VVEPGGVSGSLVNLNDILPTLAELAGVALTAEYQADGVSLVPVLRGAAELERKNLFVHYEPMWPTGRPARYAFDRRWKLYQDGDFFDTKADPLEQSPLDTGTLDAEAGAAHRALAARIQGMPGQLRSTGRWLPKQFYLALAVAALVFAILVISLWRLARSVIGRRAERKDR